MTAPLERLELEPALAGSVEEVIAAFAAHHPDDDTSLITAAAALAEAAHEGQFRRSGDRYFTHPLAVAGLVADLGLDAASVAAALAHDVVEDTPVTLEQVAAATSAEVAALVDGLTKIQRLPHASAEETNAATLRKLLVAVARDLRVLVVKLADRLHNMLTLGALPEEKAARIAAETLAVYAPLAHRLGVGTIKWRLEDLAFRASDLARYAELAAMVDARIGERAASLQVAIAAVEDAVTAAGIDAEVRGRVKHLWSAHETMVLKHKTLDELTDLVGVRVIVGDVQSCYRVLGAIHSMPQASPIPGRFKDFIAAPKWNSYQSLHVAVVLAGGQPLEVQIRTADMHRRAEIGVAAHWSYKAGRRQDASARELAWFGRLLESESEGEPAAAFLAQLKADLTDDEVYCFTPKGRVVALPAGSCPVDFAYQVHSDVGAACVGARVNGQLVPLRTQLSSGDTVEVLTRPGRTQPSRDWLGFVRTARARSQIRSFYAKAQRSDNLEVGRESVARALRLEGLPARKLTGSAELAAAVRSLRYGDIDSAYVAIGEGRLAVASVVTALRAELGEVLPAVVLPERRPAKTAQVERAVHVEGLDDLLVHFAGCCDPQPFGPIAGFVTIGRGVSVHAADCSNVVSLISVGGGRAERMIDVEWVGAPSTAELVTIEVSALDRAKLLRDVAAVLSDAGVNIISSNTHTSADRSVRQRFDFEMADRSHLGAVLDALSKVDAVYDVRQLPAG